MPSPSDILRQLSTTPITDPVQAGILYDQSRQGTPFPQGLRTAGYGIGAGATALGGDVAEYFGLNPTAASLRQYSDDLHAQAQRASGGRYSLQDVVSGELPVSSYLSYGAGQAIPSLGTAIGGAMLGRGLLRSPIGTHAGGYGTAGVLEAGETASTLREDPVTRALPVEDRLKAEAVKGAVGGALEWAVPAAGINRMAKAASSTARLTPAHVTKQAGIAGVGEAATEAAQTVLGQQVHGALNPARDASRDAWDVADAAIFGFLPGSTIGGVTGAVEGAVGSSLAAAEGTRKIGRDIGNMALGDAAPDMLDALKRGDAAGVASIAAERAKTAGVAVESMMADAKVPDYIKEQANALKGMVSDAAARTKIAELWNQSEFIKNAKTAVNDFRTKASTLFKDNVEGFKEGFKKNEQETSDPSPELIAKLLAQVKAELRAEPEVQRVLKEVAQVVDRVAKLEKPDPRAVLAFANNSLFNRIFTDPEQTLISMGLKSLEVVTPAVRDTYGKQPGLLEMSIPPHIRSHMSPADVRNVARMVDGGTPAAELVQYFGSSAAARNVVRHYRTQAEAKRRAFLHGGDPQSFNTVDDGGAADNTPRESDDAPADADDSLAYEDERTMNERDNPAFEYTFADAKDRVPFRRGEAPKNLKGRVIPFGKYVKDNDLDANKEAQALVDRLQARITRDGKNPKPGMKAELEKLRSYLEGRQTLMGRGKLLRGADAVLEQYEVVEQEHEANDAVASDADLARMRTLVRAGKAPETSITFHTLTPREYAAKYDVSLEEAATETKGTDIVLSAESMWRTWSAKGTDKPTDEEISRPDYIKRMFAAAVAAVLARPEMSAVDRETGELGIPLEDDLVINRAGPRLTWGDLKAKPARDPELEKRVAAGAPKKGQWNDSKGSEGGTDTTLFSEESLRKDGELVNRTNIETTAKPPRAQNAAPRSKVEKTESGPNTREVLADEQGREILTDEIKTATKKFFREWTGTPAQAKLLSSAHRVPALNWMIAAAQHNMGKMEDIDDKFVALSRLVSLAKDRINVLTRDQRKVKEKPAPAAKVVTPRAKPGVAADVTAENRGKAAVEAGKESNEDKKLNAMAVDIHRDLGKTGIAASHVSPIRHEGKFDWRKNMGKGEGAAAFGAGTYLSTADEVHKYYKDALAPEVPMDLFPGDKEKIRKSPDEFFVVDPIQGVIGSAPTLEAAREKARVEQEAIEERHGGQITQVIALSKAELLRPGSPTSFHVTINAKQSELLNWDAPLSDQSQHVRNALATAKLPPEAKNPRLSVGAEGHRLASLESLMRGNNSLGSRLYTMLSIHLGSDRAASEYLQSLGIVGHKYAAAGGKQSTKPNYVIYDDSRIETNYVELNAQNLSNAAALSTEDQKTVREEMRRILGPKVRTLFKDNLGYAGSFEEHGVDEVITLAINMSAPMANAVAYHEAAHAFFKRLITSGKAGRDVAEILQRVAEDGLVMHRLRNLLADHPKALEQLEDREERVAYMFQFWASGQLTIPKDPRTLFQKIAKFLRDVLGVLSQYERAELVMAALHGGKFAERATTAAVLADLDGRTFAEKAAALTGPLAEFSNKALNSATDQLREMKSKAMNEIADKFYQDVGQERGGLGFLQRRQRQQAIYLNKLSDLLDGSSAEHRQLALTALQSMEDITALPGGARVLAEKIKALQTEIFEYMKDVGVQRINPKWDPKNPGDVQKWIPLQDRKDYFTRTWDRDIVRNNAEEFAALLVKEGPMSKLDALEIIKNITQFNGDADLVESAHHIGFTPFAQQVIKRKLDFINKANAAKFAKFQSQDITEIMTSYIYQATHRGEYVRAFADDEGTWLQDKLREAKKQGLSDEEVTRAGKIVMALEGTLGYDMNPRLREAYSNIVVYENIALLPFAIFNSLIDPLGIALRTGELKDAWSAFKTGMKGIQRDLARDKTIDAQTELAKTLGLIDDQNVLENYGTVQAGMYMGKWLKRVNETFFRWNGMQGWNKRMRVAAMVAGQRFILRHAEAAGMMDSRKPQTLSGSGEVSTDVRDEGHSARYMKEMGLEAGDVMELADGRLAMFQHEGLSAEQERRVQEAVFRFVDSAVLRPNAAHRPVWMSDPHFMLIGHLKQFTFTFHSVILKRALHEVKNGNQAAAWIFASYVPFMIAADIVRGGLTGNLKDNWGMMDYITHGIERAGVLGKGNFAVDSLQDAAFGTVPGASLLGPAAGHAVDATQTVAGHDSWSSLLFRSLPAGPLAKSVVG